LWSRYAIGQAHGQINKQDILIGCGVNIMAEYQCTCHCGGDMFYRHMHAESCPLSIYGDEVPGTEVDTLKRQVADLTAKLAAVTQERDAAKEQVRDLIAKLDILSKYVWCETGEFGFPDGDVIQVRKGRNYTDLRPALLALPVVVKELEQALDVLDDYYDGAEDSSIKWLGEPMYYVRNAKERLAQGMRGRE